MDRFLAAPRIRWTAAGLLLLVLVMVPLVVIPYVNYQLSLIGVWAVAILGLNFISGYAGPLSLGQSAFVGIGAYAAVFGVNHGWPVPLIFLFSCAFPAVIGLIIAIPTARLRGPAFAIGTIVLPIVAVPLANRFPSLTGGAAGISVSWLEAPSWSGLATDQWRYYLVLLVGLLFFLAGRNFVRGKFGRALQLLRDDELVASASGIDGYRYRLLAFTASALYGGAAGFLYLVAVQYVTPQTLVFLSGLYMVAAMVIGGRGSVVGSLFGGVFYVVVPVIAGQVSASETTLIYGVILLVVLFAVPDGIVSLPARLSQLARRRNLTARSSSSAIPKEESDEVPVP